MCTRFEGSTQSFEFNSQRCEGIEQSKDTDVTQFRKVPGSCVETLIGKRRKLVREVSCKIWMQDIAKCGI